MQPYIVKRTTSPRAAARKLPSCLLTITIKGVFDEIFLSVFDKTLKSRMQRSLTAFDDLCQAGIIGENTRFSMRCDNRNYKTKTVKNSRNIFYPVLLGENGNYYKEPNNKIIGVYNMPSQTAVDAINFSAGSTGFLLFNRCAERLIGSRITASLSPTW